MRGALTVAQNVSFARMRKPEGLRHVSGVFAFRLTIAATVAVTLGISACQRAEAAFDADAIIAMERAALERWGKGDPQGYVEIMAPEITYFDPVHEKRVDGLTAMKE